MPEKPGHDHKDEDLGRRTLAAIMFTDVVGFSRRTGVDEDRTLRLTARDQWKDTPPDAGGADRRIIDGVLLFAEDNSLKAEALLSWLEEGDDETPGPSEDASVLFRRFDRNADGAITDDELPEGMPHRMMRSDRNGDGRLTLDEFQEWRRAPRRRPMGP